MYKKVNAPVQTIFDKLNLNELTFTVKVRLGPVSFFTLCCCISLDFVPTLTFKFKGLTATIESFCAIWQLSMDDVYFMRLSAWFG